jgi:hypothetical protein
MINLSKLKLRSSGLVHRIYEKEGQIYKIPKNSFKEFHDKEHFLIERESLNLLKRRGLSSIKVFKIIDKKENSLGLPILIESFAEGYQKRREKLIEKEILSILHLLKEAHKIKLSGYGPMNRFKRGKYSNWEKFLNRSSSDGINYLAKNKILKKLEAKKIEELLSRNMHLFSFKGKGSFVLVDANPLNFFFKKGKIKQVIDIDHPIIGDPLYEYASLRWYHKKIFSVFSSKKNLNFLTVKKILLYEIIHGLEVIKWMHHNQLSVKREVKKIRLLVSNLEESLIKLSNISLLIIKPECFSKFKDIIRELNHRGFSVEWISERNNFNKMVSKIYSDDYPLQKLKFFSKAYLKSNFGNKFYILLVKKNSGNTFNELSKEIGHYKNYQKVWDNSLRCKFGLPQKYNFHDKQNEMFFNGLHRTDNAEDFIKHLNFLNLDLI